MFDQTDLIHAYTRMQALEDGVLVDITTTAIDAGFRDPVALTSTVFERCVVDPRDPLWEKGDGRVWDIVWMLKHAITKLGAKGPQVRFVVLIDTE